MMRFHVWVSLLLFLGSSFVTLAQQPAAPSNTASNAVVPTLVSFSGVLAEVNGKPLTGITGVTFSLYAEQQGGSPLWLETQNVQPDATGHYSVTLGATSSTGLPASLFTAGQARWLGVQPQGQTEQPRVMLLSVPYAMKAGDAQTVGGMPASAFVQVAPSGNSGTATNAPANPGSPESPALSGTGTTDFVPLWTNSTTLGDSVLFQSGAGSTAKVGINNTTPASTLDVKGNATVRGYLETPAIANATASQGSNSNPMVLVASSFNSSTSKAVTQNFVWQAEPTENDTTTPSGTLNLLFGAGTATPAETGLKLSNNGLFTFATGQTFPNTGTITGVTTASGSGLTGGGTSGTLNLALTSTCAAHQVLQWNGSAWACSSAGAGTVTSVGSGAGLTGGPITGSGTLSVATGGVSNSMLQNSTFTLAANSPLTGGGTFSLGGSASLSLSSCGNNQVLEYISGIWTCANLGSGTITGVTAGTGLSGGGTSGNVTLTNTGLLGLTAGPGISVGSGQTPTVSVSGVPTLTGNNTFTGGNGFTVAVGTAVFASTPDQSYPAIEAEENSGTTTGVGLYGNSGEGTAVLGNSAIGIGVTGQSGGTGVYGVGYYAMFAQAENGEYGLLANSDISSAILANGSNTGNAAGIAGYFTGNVTVTGSISQDASESNIDHPLDPANKYLHHSFVESPDMMNIYNGNVTTDSGGLATITLPDWFGALNRDFRYQLTVIGQFAQAIVAHEIENNQFEIKTSLPDVKVSWQVTGIRQDAWANAHRIPVEEEKDAQLKGFYLHPELYGAPAEKQIDWAIFPQAMKQMQENRQKANEKRPRLGQTAQ